MKDLISYKFEELNIGDEASITKTIKSEDVELFSRVSEDINPLHLDDEFAKTTIFKKRIAHGMLGASLISAVIANKLPGIGTIYLGQDLKFTKPVFIGDTITAKVEVKEKREDRKIIILKTTVVNQDSETVITGEATVMKND